MLSTLLKFLCKASALLRDHQKTAASKPTSWPFRRKTTLISLNSNFGTLLTLVLGCFPLDIQPYRTMSDYLIFIYGPSENKYSLIESSRPPNVHKGVKWYVYLANHLTQVAWDHNSVPTNIIFKLPTYIGFAENQLS